MNTSKYKMEVTTVMAGTPTAIWLETMLARVTGDIVTVIKEE